MSISEKDCIEWSKNKLINPFTNRPIVKNGPTYTFFNENCEKYLQSSHCFNLKGLKNIGGTSCYMDSVLFALLAVPNSFVQKTLSGSFNVRNLYLKDLLEQKGKNTEEIWSSIATNKGSVQHLEFLTKHEKDVFKTAFELDQRWLVDLSAQRTPFICQSQSLNIFLSADVHKRDLHQIHFQAWKKGLKSMYYLRSMSIQRSDVVAEMATNGKIVSVDNNINDYEECISCQ